jgi:hypothetical protein
VKIKELDSPTKPDSPTKLSGFPSRPLTNVPSGEEGLAKEAVTQMVDQMKSDLKAEFRKTLQNFTKEKDEEILELNDKVKTM